jgi:hypothetical protein
MTLYQPINQRWVEERGENWSHGKVVDDGIVKRSATVEATTRLGRRALRIIEALHAAHPFNELETPERGTWYEGMAHRARRRGRSRGRPAFDGA